MQPSTSPHPVRARRRRPLAVVAGLALLAALLAGCAGEGEDSAGTPDFDEGRESEVACAPEELPDPVEADDVAAADTSGTTITLLTHDSFNVSDGVLEQFTADTGIRVEHLSGGDAGTVVSQAVLTAGDPVADVLYGIDTTFLCRGTRAGVFVPYESPGLDQVDDALELDPDHLVSPIDVGDVCLNYSKAAYPTEDDAPQDLDDLTTDRFADQLVTQNPETSSPGMAFLLATIARYGDGWERYWKDLRANGVEVTSGWTEAWEDHFGAGTGERTVVTSYATSPVADVVYADPPRDASAVGVVAGSCFRQVEFAGILRGTDEPEAAAKLIDFLLSRPFQEDLPLQMFVEPVNQEAVRPPEFEAHRVPVHEPFTMTPAEIEAGRDEWTERWTELVLR